MPEETCLQQAQQHAHLATVFRMALVVRIIVRLQRQSWESNRWNLRLLSI